MRLACRHIDVQGSSLYSDKLQELSMPSPRKSTPAAGQKPWYSATWNWIDGEWVAPAIRH
jgi:hypothetical protein